MSNDLKAIFEQRKLNNRAESIEIPKAFTDKFPDMTHQKALKHFNKYIDVMMAALVTKLPFLAEDDVTYVSTHDIQVALGTFNYKNVRMSLWNEFKDIYPLFKVLVPGSNLSAAANPYERNTKVQILNKRLIAMILTERSPRVVFEELFDGVDLSDADPIAIDMENLNNYIGNTQHELTKSPNQALRAKLEKSLYQAQLIYKVGEYTEAEAGMAYLPMVQSPSAFGRTYYKGLNIQNVTKQVRSAMIGAHYQYDMNAAIYAVKLALYNKLNGGENNLVDTELGTYTRDYLRDKNVIRNRLARDHFNELNLPWESKVKMVKNALTAIGFGARTTGGYWYDENGIKGPALDQIMSNKESRQRFMADPWVVNFIAEQLIIEEALIGDLKASGEYDRISKEIKAANKSNGSVTKSHVLAFIFQHWETQVMDEAVAIIEAHGFTVLARIHDALLVKVKLPVRVMDEVLVHWGKKYSSYMTLDADEVGEWRPVEVKKALEAHDALAALHKAHIRNEDRMARIYAMKKSGGAA